MKKITEDLIKDSVTRGMMPEVSMNTTFEQKQQVQQQQQQQQREMPVTVESVNADVAAITAMLIRFQQAFDKEKTYSSSLEVNVLRARDENQRLISKYQNDILQLKEQLRQSEEKAQQSHQIEDELKKKLTLFSNSLIQVRNELTQARSDIDREKHEHEKTRQQSSLALQTEIQRVERLGQDLEDLHRKNGHFHREMEKAKLTQLKYQKLRESYEAIHQNREKTDLALQKAREELNEARMELAKITFKGQRLEEYNKQLKEKNAQLTRNGQQVKEMVQENQRTNAAPPNPNQLTKLQPLKEMLWDKKKEIARLKMDLQKTSVDPLSAASAQAVDRLNDLIRQREHLQKTLTEAQKKILTVSRPPEQPGQSVTAPELS